MKDTWLKFRSSNTFLYCLLIFLGGWYAARWINPFDSDNSILNIILSAEASVATCLILDLQFKSMSRDHAMLEQLLNSEKRIIETLDDIEAVERGRTPS